MSMELLYFVHFSITVIIQVFKLITIFNYKLELIIVLTIYRMRIFQPLKHLLAAVNCYRDIKYT